jgi:hypothetical protein
MLRPFLCKSNHQSAAGQHDRGLVGHSWGNRATKPRNVVMVASGRELTAAHVRAGTALIRAAGLAGFSGAEKNAAAVGADSARPTP